MGGFDPPRRDQIDWSAAIPPTSATAFLATTHQYKKMGGKNAPKPTYSTLRINLYGTGHLEVSRLLTTEENQLAKPKWAANARFTTS